MVAGDSHFRQRYLFTFGRRLAALAYLPQKIPAEFMGKGVYICSDCDGDRVDDAESGPRSGTGSDFHGSAVALRGRNNLERPALHVARSSAGADALTDLGSGGRLEVDGSA